MLKSSSKTTTDLKTIQKWAEERDGKPSRVKSTADDDGGGVLRIDFPGYSGKDTLEEMSWEEWFEPSTNVNLLFYTRTIPQGERKAAFLN